MQNLIIEQNGNVHIDGVFTRIRVHQGKDSTTAQYIHPLGWVEQVKLPHQRYSLKHDGYEGKNEGIAGRKQFIDDILRKVGAGRAHDGKTVLMVEQSTPYYMPESAGTSPASFIWSALRVAMDGSFPSEQTTHVSALVARHYTTPEILPSLIKKMCQRFDITEEAIQSITAAVNDSLRNGQAIFAASNPAHAG